MEKPVILTGLRANNRLTLGNYFGGMLPIIDMAKQKSNEYAIHMFIPDLHSFTTPIDHNDLYEQILNNARFFAAAGLPLDNPSIRLYRQSYISAHSELTWIFDCFTGFGEMRRMTQFKDKSTNLSGDENAVSVGLFNYPVLMAADILLYGAKYVPVGDDQSQHLEFTRDIAMRMNNRFGDLFIVPETVNKQHTFFGKDQGLRIMDLMTPTKKMSKSDESGKGVIFLTDDPAAAAKKIMSATTDDKAYIAYDKANQPGISNLLEILALLQQKPLQQVVDQYSGQTRYGDFKKVVASEIEVFLQQFQNNLRDVDNARIKAKLEESEAVVANVANITLYKVQQAVGIRPKGTI